MKIMSIYGSDQENFLYKQCFYQLSTVLFFGSVSTIIPFPDTKTPPLQRYHQDGTGTVKSHQVQGQQNRSSHLRKIQAN